DFDAVVHLHGMASRPEYDGYATDYIPPNYYKDYIYPNDRAATIWYHDHQLHQTADNVKKGLLGMYIVEDEYELGLNLPSGEFDVPLILQQHPNSRDILLVNGALKPYMEVMRHKYRFRVLNATANKVDDITVVKTEDESHKINLKVIGTDGGLRENPVDTDELEIAPGERYEFVIDFNELYDNPTKMYDLKFGDDQVLRFKINPSPVTDNSDVPGFLRSVKRFDNCHGTGDCTEFSPPSDCETTLTFDQDGQWLINGKGWPEIVACAPAFDESNRQYIVWKLHSAQGTHPVHIHLSDLQIIEHLNSDNQSIIDDKPYKQNCWKDIFLIRAEETVTVAGIFGPHTGKYMMHCHNLFHEDNDMMVNFVVGEDPSEAEDPSMIAPAQPISGSMPNLCSGTYSPTTMPKTIYYDADAIRKYNLEIYGPDSK
ncbi:MAG: multicopper oxidase family protein, partial [Moorea sp. SIO3C2]|nr:multicopper oxidase family protein [Moorena sp. SIO3C2]